MLPLGTRCGGDGLLGRQLDVFVYVGTLKTGADMSAKVDPWSGTCGCYSVSQRQLCKAHSSLDFFKIRPVFVPSLSIDH